MVNEISSGPTTDSADRDNNLNQRLLANDDLRGLWVQLEIAEDEAKVVERDGGTSPSSLQLDRIYDLAHQAALIEDQIRDNSQPQDE